MYGPLGGHTAEVFVVPELDVWMPYVPSSLIKPWVEHILQKTGIRITLNDQTISSRNISPVLYVSSHLGSDMGDNEYTISITRRLYTVKYPQILIRARNNGGVVCAMKKISQLLQHDGKEWTLPYVGEISSNKLYEK